MARSKQSPRSVRAAAPAPAARTWALPAGLQAVAAALLVVAAVPVVFAPVLTADFLSWDDNLHLFDNPHLRPVTWRSVAYFWRHPYFAMYIPVTYTFFSGETWLSERVAWGTVSHGMSPTLFHLGSVALHAANSLLVWGLLRRIVANPWAACLGALLFSLHPLQVESVAWISETKGLLAAMFCLLGAHLWLGFGRPGGESSEPRAGFNAARAGRYLLLVVCFVLAMLSKPSAVALPLVLPLVDWGFRGRRLRHAALEAAPLVLLGLVMIVATKRLQPDEGIRQWTGFDWRPLIAGDSLAFYLKKLVLPIWLAPDYGRRPWDVIARGWVYVTPLVPLVVCGMLACAPWRRQLLAALGIFTAALLPTLGLVPFGYQDISTVADRYAYLAMLGPALLLAWCAARWPLRATWTFAAALVGACGLLAAAQAQHWHNERTLFAYCLRVSPRSYIAYVKLGLVDFDAGRYADAIALFERALAIDPDYTYALNNLAAAYHRQGDLDRSIKTFERAIELSPNEPTMLFNLGSNYMQKKEYAKAVERLARSAELSPYFMPTRMNLALGLSQLGRDAEAAEQIAVVLAKKPQDPEALYSAGVFQYRLGNRAAARDYFQQVLRVRPDDARTLAALAKLDLDEKTTNTHETKTHQATP